MILKQSRRGGANASCCLKLARDAGFLDQAHGYSKNYAATDKNWMNEKMNTIKLRPHHILCLSLFEGKGYNAEFTANMERILDNFQDLEIVQSADDICACCPNSDHGECTLGEDDVKNKDKNVLASLALATGNVSVRSINDALSRLTTDQFELCCRTCRWYKGNVCRFEKIKQF